jgi:hypothetical protein
MVCAGKTEVRPSKSAVLETKRGIRRDLGPVEGGDVGGKKGQHSRERNLAPVTGRWAAACFPVGSETTEAEIRELLKESADSAKDEYGPEAAVAWAEEYAFPPEYVRNDMRRRRRETFWQWSVNAWWSCNGALQLGAHREVAPERALLRELAGGMKVHLPEGFMANDLIPRTDQRPIYEMVASAVNKMLGALVEVAQQHVPNLHLRKAHWTVKKGKPSGRPLGDLSKDQYGRDRGRNGGITVRSDIQ